MTNCQASNTNMTQAITFDTAAHRLLEDLDRRHDELLQQLDDLDQRVLAVLSQYITIRPETAEPTAESPAPAEDDDEE
ncbi:MAG: hypothetical protein ACTHK7_06150 [Aureliella sp.]